MCGRYALHSHPSVIALAFGLDTVPDFAPRYNVAPGTPVLALRAGAGHPEAVMLRWGLVPGWARDPAIGSRLINARAETLADKPSFRNALRRRRCIVPADGFYEWQQGPAGKQPWYVRPATGMFGFAGLWETWSGPEGPLATCCIVTCAAGEAMRPIHARMPAILDPADYGRWLDPDTREPEALLHATDALALHPVSARVNRVGNDDAGLIEPVAARA